jgi:hypothetical protein
MMEDELIGSGYRKSLTNLRIGEYVYTRHPNLYISYTATETEGLQLCRGSGEHGAFRQLRGNYSRC